MTRRSLGSVPEPEQEQEQVPPRTLAQRYLDEGLRMDEDPLIRFVGDRDLAEGETWLGPGYSPV